MKNEKSVLKWLNNELSSKEINDLKKSENFKTLEKIAHYSSQMQASKVNAKEALAAFRLKNSSKTKDTLTITKVRKLNFAKYYKYAAILVVAITVGYLTLYNTSTDYTTNIAQTKTITLPDNSQVILNAVSALSFNKKKWEKERHLNLHGEAFFKVSKGEKFTVETGAGNIQVLGTQFNVKERDDYFEVQCYEGLVAVTYNNETVKLSKGKVFRVIDNKIEIIEGLNSQNPSWINNESSFVKVPLKHIIEDLENNYDIKIVTKDINTNKLFTGTFTHNNLDIALQLITTPLKLTYKAEGNTITLYKYEE